MGKCDGVTVLLQGLTITQNLFRFCLGGVDVILGVHWLHKLGEVKINWQKQTMRFMWEERRTELKGDLVVMVLETTLNMLMKDTREREERYWLEMA